MEEEEEWTMGRGGVGHGRPTPNKGIRGGGMR